MSWHGCTHCAIRGVHEAGVLCQECRERWGHRTARTCPCRKCYFWRWDHGSRHAYPNAPENQPDWKGYLDEPDGVPELPLHLRPNPETTSIKETT